MKCFLAFALCALATCALPVQGDSMHGKIAPDSPVTKDTDSAITEAVNKAAKTFLENKQTVGLSIGLVKDGKEYTYNFGTTERGKEHPPTAHTRYYIASITKTFTGALLARAVTEKKVNFDDDIRKYLPGQFPNLEYQGEPLRLWQLINHTSGLPRNMPEVADPLPGEDTDAARQSVKEAAILEKYTQDDFLRDLHNVKLTRTPGVKFSYSNAAAQLLGLVLERVYGKSYDDLLRTKIAGPLKMNNTKVTLNTGEIARLPRGYALSGAFLPALPTRLPAAGSLTSTTADMLKYIEWNLAETDEVARLVHQSAGNTVWSGDGSFTVGLNWQILKTPAGRNIFQDGNVPGFHSMCVLCPELKLGIIVLTNEEVQAKPAELSPLINQIFKAVDSRTVAIP